MIVHKLKVLQPYFNDIATGVKLFEVRFNDRDYEVGDILFLVEYPQVTPVENILVRQVSYILHGGVFGIKTGFVVMSLKSFT